MFRGDGREELLGELRKYVAAEIRDLRARRDRFIDACLGVGRQHQQFDTDAVAFGRGREVSAEFGIEKMRDKQAGHNGIPAGTWNELLSVKPSELTADRLPVFLEWVKQRSMTFRGAVLGTMLRNENYYFSQLGNFIERADNTARILDVKYFILLPKPSDVGSELDMQQWAQILRSVSAHRSYRWFYRDSRYRPWLVAEFLILREEMPRSLVFSHQWINTALEGLGNLHGQRYACHEMAAESLARLRAGKMEDIFQGGLHEYLSSFIATNTNLSASISQTYHFP